MTDKHEQLLIEASRITLRPEEREAIRRQLTALTVSYIPRPAAGIWGFVTRHALSSLAIAAVVLAGGTTAFANGSKPGDLLYPVRTGVNDRVAVALTFSDDAKMDVELGQIDRELNDEDAAMDSMVAREMATGKDEEETVQEQRDENRAAAIENEEEKNETAPAAEDVRDETKADIGSGAVQDGLERGGKDKDRRGREHSDSRDEGTDN